MRIRRGVERGSVAICVPRKDQPVSIELTNHLRLTSAMIKLYIRVVDQSCRMGTIQAAKASEIVGIRIFSIVGG